MAISWPARILLVTFGAWGGTAVAHDLSVDVQLAPPAVVTKASYGGTEAVPFAVVQVTPPGGKDTRPPAKTDHRGYYSFVPDRPGTWKIVIDDEMGHRGERIVEIPERFEETRASTLTGPSRAERAVTGVALLLGLTGVLYGWRARKNAERT